MRKNRLIQLSCHGSYCFFNRRNITIYLDQFGFSFFKLTIDHIKARQERVGGEKREKVRKERAKKRKYSRGKYSAVDLAQNSLADNLRCHSVKHCCKVVGLSLDYVPTSLLKFKMMLGSIGDKLAVAICHCGWTKPAV